MAQGDARIASGDRNSLEGALELWQQAVEEGIEIGAQASLTAQKRIQMYTLTCLFAENLSGIEIDPLVSVRARQQALTALGYYPGPLDGRLTPLTRSAIRRFQREMAWNETGDLKPRQIIYLMCNGAETARDPVTLTRLSLMYIAGAGVERNLGYARKFLTDASPRYSEATFLLSLFYGTGHCQFAPKDPDRADQFLKEAADQKHSTAAELLRVYGAIPNPADRWEKIYQGPAAKKALAILGDPCPRAQPGAAAPPPGGAPPLVAPPRPTPIFDPPPLGPIGQGIAAPGVTGSPIVTPPRPTSIFNPAPPSKIEIIVGDGYYKFVAPDFIIHFPGKDCAIRSQADRTLTDLTRDEAGRNAFFQLIGFTDRKGTKEENLRKSQCFADETKRALIAKGAREERITTYRRGEDEAIKKEMTDGVKNDAWNVVYGFVNPASPSTSTTTPPSPGAGAVQPPPRE